MNFVIYTVIQFCC